jgi:hypothetical protein
MLQHTSDHSRSVQTLLDIEVRTRLVKHVNIDLLDAGKSDDESLELSA